MTTITTMSATSNMTGRSAARRRGVSCLQSFRCSSRSNASVSASNRSIVEPDSGGDQRPGHAGTPRLIRAAHIPGVEITVIQEQGIARFRHHRIIGQRAEMLKGERTRVRPRSGGASYLDSRDRS